MTCNGCRNHVEEILSEVEGVSTASVDLEKGEAAVEMEKHIPIEKFQDALKMKDIPSEMWAMKLHQNLKK